jgi:hypothetical protein
MSSKTAPYEGSTPRAQQRAPLPDAMDAPVPSYAEANGLAPSVAIPNATPRTEVAPLPAADELPGYDTIDPKNTTFHLYSTFIHTPNGAAYQLSSPLDSSNSPLRLRRLRAAEIPLAHNLPIHFDRSQTLYEVQDPPFRENEYYMVGQKPHCYGGVLQLTFGWKTWHIRHIPGPNSVPREILTCKKVSASGGLFGKGKSKAPVVMGNLTDPFEWKDMNGRLLATEGLQVMPDGGIVPTVHLSEDLDTMWRELMISFWVARLWATFR